MPAFCSKRLLRLILTTSLPFFGAIPLVLYGQQAAIVPHRFLVVYRDGAIPGDAELRATAAGTHLVQRNDRLGIAVVQTIKSAASTKEQSVSLEGETATLNRLRADPNVEYVLHDRIVTAHQLHILPVAKEATFRVAIAGASPYDTFYNSPQGWAVRQVGGYGADTPGGPARGPWDTTTGKGVRIAILDSGVDQNHPDIAPNLALNLTEVNQRDLPTPCDDGSPQDQEGHGTWTASLAAGAMGPGTGQIIGVAPSATLLNIKVLERMPQNTGGSVSMATQCTSGQASGLLSWVIQGIQDAVTNHADVISMSLGATIDLTTGEGAGLKATFDRVTDAATQAGVVLVAAAGNDGYDLSNPQYVELPAQSRGVLAVVASTNPACVQNTSPNATCAPGAPALAYYSNYGTSLNALAAPGGSYPAGNDDYAISGWIRGACSSGLAGTVDGIPSDSQHSFGCFNLGHAAYVQTIGTSASAPLAAGVAALLRAAHPTWDAITIVNAMRSSGDSISTLPVPQVDAAAAISQP